MWPTSVAYDLVLSGRQDGLWDDFVGRMSFEDLWRQKFVALRPRQPAAPGDRDPTGKLDGNSCLVISRRALPSAGLVTRSS